MLTSLKRSPLHRLSVTLLACIGWMTLIFVLSHRQTIPVPPGFSAQLTSVAGHFTVYMVLATLIYWTLSLLMADTGWRYLVAWTLAVLYGISDEWHQSFVPGRTPDVLDIVTDALGAATGLLIIWWWRSRLLSGEEPQASSREASG